MAEAPPMSLMTIVDESVPSFVSLDEKHLCVVCHKTLQSPLQTTCGHRMCRLCLEKLFQDQPEGASIPCPGREDGCDLLTLGEVYPDFCANKELQQKSVYCKNRAFGCPARIQWKKLKEHLASCAYKGRQCAYKNFGCSALIPEKDYKQHINSGCDYIPTECGYCKENVPRKMMQDHERNACRKRPVTCPYKCGKKDTREKIEEHEESCPMRPEECKFKINGCSFKGSKGAVAKHMEDAALDHVTILSAIVTTQTATIEIFKSQVQEINAEKEGFRQLCETLKTDHTKLRQKIESHEKKIRDLQRNAALQAEEMVKLEEKTSGFVKQDELRGHEREIIRLKDGQSNLEGKIRSLEHTTGGATGIPADLRQKIMTYDRQMGIHDVRLAEMDLRFQCLETSSYNGVLIWKVTEYQRRKDEAIAGRTLSLYSQAFFTSRYGYKMCGRVYINGDGVGKNTHMSLFFVVMRGEYDNLMPWPFRCKVTLTLMDQTGGGRHCSDTFRPDPTSTSFKRPVSEMNIASGCPCFVPQSTLEKSPFLVNDTVFIKVTVDTSDLPLP